MFRYQLLIEYVGTNFKGWQIQKRGSTIQGLIQKKLKKLLNEKIILNGSGRTDKGVHAIEQSAHFDCKFEIVDLKTSGCKSLTVIEPCTKEVSPPSILKPSVKTH